MCEHCILAVKIFGIFNSVQFNYFIELPFELHDIFSNSCLYYLRVQFLKLMDDCVLTGAVKFGICCLLFNDLSRKLPMSNLHI